MIDLDSDFEFFIYLLEHYSAYRHSSADRILKQWDRLGLTDRIFSMYELYHCERLQNAFDDIDRMVREKAG